MKKKDLEKLLGKPTELFELFHNKTKNDSNSKKKNGRLFNEWKTISYKAYSRLEEITLPKPYLSNSTSLKEALDKRQSDKNFAKKPITRKQLSTLLFYSAGIKNAQEKRFYPSAGGRYPLEIYIVSLNTELPKGIYHYYVKHNSLEKLASFQSFNSSSFYNASWIKKSGCIVIITAVFRRTTSKYGNRGYRHILSEAGHMAQNISLISSALTLSFCPIGRYIDDSINTNLELDNLHETVVYVGALGSKIIDNPSKI